MRYVGVGSDERMEECICGVFFVWLDLPQIA